MENFMSHISNRLGNIFLDVYNKATLVGTEGDYSKKDAMNVADANDVDCDDNHVEKDGVRGNIGVLFHQDMDNNTPVSVLDRGNTPGHGGQVRSATGEDADKMKGKDLEYMMDTRQGWDGDANDIEEDADCEYGPLCDNDDDDVDKFFFSDSDSCEGGDDYIMCDDQSLDLMSVYFSDFGSNGSDSDSDGYETNRQAKNDTVAEDLKDINKWNKVLKVETNDQNKHNAMKLPQKGNKTQKLNSHDRQHNIDSRVVTPVSPESLRSRSRMSESPQHDKHKGLMNIAAMPSEKLHNSFSGGFPSQKSTNKFAIKVLENLSLNSAVSLPDFSSPSSNRKNSQSSKIKKGKLGLHLGFGLDLNKSYSSRSDGCVSPLQKVQKSLEILKLDRSAHKKLGHIRQDEKTDEISKFDWSDTTAQEEAAIKLNEALQHFQNDPEFKCCNLGDDNLTSTLEKKESAFKCFVHGENGTASALHENGSRDQDQRDICHSLELNIHANTDEKPSFCDDHEISRTKFSSSGLNKKCVVEFKSESRVNLKEEKSSNHNINKEMHEMLSEDSLGIKLNKNNSILKKDKLKVEFQHQISDTMEKIWKTDLGKGDNYGKNEKKSSASVRSEWFDSKQTENSATSIDYPATTSQSLHSNQHDSNKSCNTQVVIKYHQYLNFPGVNVKPISSVNSDCPLCHIQIPAGEFRILTSTLTNTPVIDSLLCHKKNSQNSKNTEFPENSLEISSKELHVMKECSDSEKLRTGSPVDNLNEVMAIENKSSNAAFILPESPPNFSPVLTSKHIKGHENKKSEMTSESKPELENSKCQSQNFRRKLFQNDTTFRWIQHNTMQAMCSPLVMFYGAQCNNTIVHQSQCLLERRFNRSLKDFTQMFLTPFVQWCSEVKDLYAQVHPLQFRCHDHTSWPFSYQGLILLHLWEITPKFSHIGGAYPLIKLSSSSDHDLGVDLCLKVIADDTEVREFPQVKEDMLDIFTMEWYTRNKVKVGSDDELGDLLKKCLLGFESSIEKLRIQDIVPELCHRCHGKKNNHLYGDGKRVHFKQASFNGDVNSSPVGDKCQNWHSSGVCDCDSCAQKSAKFRGDNSVRENNCDSPTRPLAPENSKNNSKVQTSGSGELSATGTLKNLWKNYYSKVKAGFQGQKKGESVSTNADSPSRESKEHSTPQNTQAPPLSLQAQPTSPDTTGDPTQDTPSLPAPASIDTPQTILDVDYDLLNSGIAILPGSRDIEDHALLFIFTANAYWQQQEVNSSELARLLLYYRNIPSEEVKKKGLKVVADIRGCSSTIVSVLLQTIHLVQGNSDRGLATLYLIAEDTTKTLVQQSLWYDKTPSYRLEILPNLSVLYNIISLDRLPANLDGVYTYNHGNWIQFFMKLDPFVSKLRTAAKYIVCIMQDLSQTEAMPKSAKEAAELLEQHEQLIRSVFEDQRLQSVQTDGESILTCLQREEIHLGHSIDYRDCMTRVEHLYEHFQTTVTRFVRLSDSRLSKLEHCLQLREFEEECAKVLSWVDVDGENALRRHDNLADNLKAIRCQQKEFEKFYFSAMSYVEKGNDLLEEASMLAQSGNFDEVTGYKELAKSLKKHLQHFMQRLERTRERIESTSKCYHLLDKTYEWALDAMKYVASMKSEHCNSPEGLDKLLRSLEVYLRDHPVMKEETFISMLDLAQKLRNEKLVEQCRVAKARCQETHKLLCLRQTTLRQAKEALLNGETPNLTSAFNTSVNSSVTLSDSKDSDGMEQKLTVTGAEGVARDEDAHLDISDVQCPSPLKKMEEVSSLSTSRMEEEEAEEEESVVGVAGSVIGNHTPRDKGDKHVSWHPQSASTPSMSSDDKRSLDVPGSFTHNSPVVLPAPVYSPEEATILEQNESFITDLSEQIVTPVPKTLSSPALRSALKDDSSSVSSRDFSVISNDSIQSPRFIPDQGPSSALNSNNRPVRKVLRRTTTAPPLLGGPIMEEEDAGDMPHPSNRPDNRTVSMITSSTDSLSSLPEDGSEQENIQPDSSGTLPKTWTTPVPVNTHLMSQSRTLPTGSLADLDISETDKTKRTLAHVMREMIQTERDYVASLHYIITNYIPELERDDVPQTLRGKRNVIFGNLEKIYQFHQTYFLKELELCEKNPFQISQYFLMHGSQFYLYALYNKNKPKSDVLMAEYGKFFFRGKQLELGDKMDLSSYLLKPVQRMGKYALLLKQIMKACGDHSTQEYQDLKAAEEMVRFQLRHGNDLLAMDSLRDCDVNLQEQGRLLRQDEFLVFQGRKKSMRHVFLFEDMVLFSKTRRGRHGSPDSYDYKFSFKTSDIGMTENYDESGYKFEIWFRRRSIGENYVLQAQTSEVKHNWVKDISRLLWNQALKNRETHLTEMATMGVGNKPCLDIKPSADNIQDRYVNVSFGNRGARTRSSIAISPYEHLRHGNKRPHSIISVSSTSSSSSSHSAPFGAYAPLYEADGTPRNRQSGAYTSGNESGIGTDISGSEHDRTLHSDSPNLSHLVTDKGDNSVPKLILSDHPEVTEGVNSTEV